MGLYSDQILPRLIHRACRLPVFAPWRDRLCEGLSGTVLEIGFGSGTNLPHYPDAVERVLAVEPNAVARGLSGRDGAVGPPVEYAGPDAQSLDLPDASVDHAVSAFTLCTVPDAGAALSELRRVVAPGGTLRFLEHGLAPEPRVRRWQHRVEPLQKRLAGGCHLAREPLVLAVSAGWEIVDATQEYLGEGPKFESYLTLAVARSPGRPGRAGQPG